MRVGAAWAALITAMIGGALLQGVTALPGSLGPGAGLIWAAIASSALLFHQLLTMTLAAVAIAGARPGARLGARLTVGAAAIATAVVVAVGVIVAVLAPLALPVVAVPALCALPAAARGRGIRAGFGVFAHAPVRATLATLVTILLSVLTWVIAVAAGLFLAGAAGGVAMWLWFGIVGALQLLWWARLQARAWPHAAVTTSP